MAYTSDKEPDQLTALTTLDSGDVFVVGDISDTSEVAKLITKADLITDLNASLTPALATTVTTNANLTGHVTSVGNAAVLGSFTLAQINTAISDANIIPEAGGTFTGDISVPAEAYGAGWNGSNEVPTKNDVYDQVELKLTATLYDDATAAETNTATSTAKYVSPDGLAGSYAGTKSAVLDVIAAATALTTGDNKYSIIIPSSLNGMDLVAAHARVFTAGTTGTTDIQLHNVTDAVDILSTKITIDSTETTSYTAATPPVINGSNDSLATGDIIRVDIDAISTTPPSGLQVILECRLP